MNQHLSDAHLRWLLAYRESTKTKPPAMPPRCNHFMLSSVYGWRLCPECGADIRHPKADRVIR